MKYFKLWYKRGSLATLLHKEKWFYLKVTFMFVGKAKFFESVMMVQFLNIDFLLSLEQNIGIVYLDI